MEFRDNDTAYVKSCNRYLKNANIAGTQLSEGIVIKQLNRFTPIFLDYINFGLTTGIDNQTMTDSLDYTLK